MLQSARAPDAASGMSPRQLFQDSYFLSRAPGKARSDRKWFLTPGSAAETPDLNLAQEIDIELNSIQYLDPG
jgi:hypothetical protein